MAPVLRERSPAEGAGGRLQAGRSLRGTGCGVGGAELWPAVAAVAAAGHELAVRASDEVLGCLVG